MELPKSDEIPQPKNSKDEESKEEDKTVSLIFY